MHTCVFGVHEYGEIIQFSEDTTRTLLYNREGLPTNHYRILLPDALELREVLDDEGTGKSWHTLTVGLEPKEERMREQSEQEARVIKERAMARSGLITVLTRRLESYDDLIAKIAAMELRNDPNWRAFTKGIAWYDRRRRKIARKRQ